MIKLVEDELARTGDAKDARRFDAAAVPAPTLSVEDLLPKADELPSCFKRTDPTLHGRTSIEALRAAHKKQGWANAYDALEGVQEAAQAVYEERGSIRLTVLGYESATYARDHFAAFRRAAETTGAAAGPLLNADSAVIQVGRFNVAVGASTTTFGYDAFLKALRARCERIAPGKLELEKLAEIAAWPYNTVQVPSEWLPEELKVDQVIALDRAPVGKTNYIRAVAYSTGRGTLIASFDCMEARVNGSPHPEEPTAEEVRAFRAAWYVDDEGTLGLATTGEVTTSTLVWFDRYVTEEARRMGKPVKRLTPEIPSDEPRNFFPGAGGAPATVPPAFDVKGLEVNLKAFKLKVTKVVAGSRAEKLGFRVGDVVKGCKVNGEFRDAGLSELTIDVAITRARFDGDDVAIVVERGGTRIDIALPDN